MITNKFTQNQVKWLKALKTSKKTKKSLTNCEGAYCCLGLAKPANL